MIADWETNCVYLAAMLEGRHPDVFGKLRSTLIDHGVEVRLLDNVRDVWARDYSPIQVENGNLVKFRYTPNYLDDAPELRTGDEVVESFRNLGSCHHSAIVLDGGNIVASRKKAILTEKIYRENRGRNQAELRNEIQKLLRVDELIIIPQEDEPVGHVDAIVRFLDEDHVLVNDYQKTDPDYGRRLLAVLRRHRLGIETVPYSFEKRSVAGIFSAVGCYTNYLRTKNVVIAPVYKSAHDPIALDKLQSVFPEVPVVTIECVNLARDGGVLNCVSSSYRLPTESDQH